MLSKKNAALVALIVAIASSISIISYEYSLYTSGRIEELSVRDTHSNADIQSHDLANSFSNRLEDVVNTLQLLSRSPSVQEGNLESAKLMFNQAKDSSSEIIDFYMWLDAGGRMVWLSNINQTAYEQFRDTDLSYRLYFSSPRDAGQLYYSSVIDSNDRVNRLYVSYPIMGGSPATEGQFQGVVVAGLRSDVIGGFLERQLSPNLSSEVALLDNTGIILYSKDLQYTGKNVFGVRFQSFLASMDVETLRAMNEGFKAALAGEQGLVDVAGQDGNRATFAYKPIILEGKQFGVLYTVTPHEYASDVASLIEQQKNFSLMLIVMTAAAAIGIIFVILAWNRRLEETVSTRTAELLKANEQLLIHDKMQQEFINIAAHELRTPIQPILGMTEMLEDEMGDRREDIRMIARNARRLERLTQDILDVTRIESQTLKITAESFDIGVLIDTLIEDYKSRLVNGDSTQLEYEPSASGPLVVQADRERVSQVITNLIDNALKFGKNERVAITAKKEEGGMISVSVRDSGAGIDADMLARLFTKFASKADRGTGLGLFISKNIVEAHGGRIWGKNNEDGKGATFTFTLPPRQP